METPARRLSDKILAAFNQACEQRDLDVADLLVQALDLTLTREAQAGLLDKRRELGPVVEAYARLKSLRAAADQARATNSK
jgi:hypothetical protein